MITPNAPAVLDPSRRSCFQVAWVGNSDMVNGGPEGTYVNWNPAEGNCQLPDAEWFRYLGAGCDPSAIGPAAYPIS